MPRLAEVDWLIQSSRIDLQRCYTDTIHLDPLFDTARSHVRVWLVVSPRGEVVDADVNHQTFLLDQSVAPCVRDIVRAWRFQPDATGGGVVFNLFSGTPGRRATIFHPEMVDPRALAASVH